MGYKVASPTVVFSVVLPGPATLYRDSLLGGAGWSGYKVASPTSTVVFSVVFNLDWQLYTSILCSGALLGGAGWSGYKVASPTSTVVFSRVLPGLATLYRFFLLGGGGRSGYKVASPTSTVVFSVFTWTGHFIEGFSARGSGMERALPGLTTL